MEISLTIKATHFRQNLFQILDQCRATGQPVRIERGGEVYDLIPRKKRVAIGALPEHPDTITVDPDKLHLVKAWDWSPDDLS